MKKIVLVLLAFFALFVLINQSHADLTTGLAGYYKFDGNANDSSGFGNNGTEQGGPAYISGQCSQAIDFDGVNDYVQLPTASNLNMGVNPFTISAFVKTSVSNNGTIFCKYATPTGFHVGFYYDTGKVHMGTFDASHGSTEILSNTSIADGQWHCVAWVREGDGTLKIYIDGVLDKSQQFPIVNIDTTIAPRIGVDAQEFLNFYEGSLDEVRVYNRALSVSEIQAVTNDCDPPRWCKIFSENFTSDLSGWNFYSHCTTNQIVSTDGNPAPSLLVDDSLSNGCFAETRQRFNYDGKEIEFSADMKPGDAANADQRYASMFVAEPGKANSNGYICRVTLNSSTEPSYPNSVSFIIKYKSGETEQFEESGWISITNGDGWHNSRIRIRADRKVEFFIDDVLLYTSTNQVTDNYDGQVVLTLGARKSLYDNALVEEVCCYDLTWHYKASMLTSGRTMGATAIVGNKIYAISGHNYPTTNEVFDTSTNTWSTKANSPSGSYGASAGTSGKEIYLIAGVGGATVHLYNTDTDSWTANVANYPLPVHGLGVVSFNGKIYCFGGEQGTGPYTYYSNVYEFDPVSKIFTTKTSMPETKRVACATELNGKVYILGGYNSSTVFNTIWAYDIATDSWTKKNAAINISTPSIGGVINNKIYVIDGHPETTPKKVYEYDPAADVVVEKTTYNETIPRIGPFGGVVIGKLYVMGGTSVPGAGIPSTEEGIIVPCVGDQPTAIMLAGFEAIAKNREVEIAWVTATETDNAGFNIYRAEAENGNYIKLNDALIPAQGFAAEGASYEFVDKDVKNRKAYYYKLEDVDLNGQSTMHGPVSATPRLIYGLGK